MVRRRVVLYSACGAALVAAILLAWWVRIRPANARAWSPEQAVLPEVEFTGHLARVRNVRNFVYAPSGQLTPGYYDATYDLDRLESVWFVLTPFSRGWRGLAHSFVSFGFSDSQFVAVSVEARREVGESYDFLAGLLKRFELMYVIGDERDLIAGRALRGEDLYLYPIRAPREKVRQLFVEMLGRAARLREHPEFYNTITNNCTSNLVRHVNRISPGKVPQGLKTMLPGYADEVALRLGLIDSRLGLPEARRRYRIADRAREYAFSDRFSFRIRGEGNPNPVRQAPPTAP